MVLIKSFNKVIDIFSLRVHNSRRLLLRHQQITIKLYEGVSEPLVEDEVEEVVGAEVGDLQQVRHRGGHVERLGGLLGVQQAGGGDGGGRHPHHHAHHHSHHQPDQLPLLRRLVLVERLLDAGHAGHAGAARLVDPRWLTALGALQHLLKPDGDPPVEDDSDHHRHDPRHHLAEDDVALPAATAVVIDYPPSVHLLRGAVEEARQADQHSDHGGGDHPPVGLRSPVVPLEVGVATDGDVTIDSQHHDHTCRAAHHSGQQPLLYVRRVCRQRMCLHHLSGRRQPHQSRDQTDHDRRIDGGEHYQEETRNSPAARRHQTRQEDQVADDAGGDEQRCHHAVRHVVQSPSELGVADVQVGVVHLWWRVRV